jgi:uncharacterized repeat protein (TIGR03803 family)
MRGKRLSIGLRALAIFAVTLLVTSTWATTNWNEKVLHSFNGGNGAVPVAGLIFDAAGNLYGTTYDGGTYGYGTVFELTPNGSGGWTETVLYNFCSQTGCADGANPAAGLIFDAAGNLYGTTLAGGSGSSTYCIESSPGCGTVFELTPIVGSYWAEAVLYSFCPQGGFCTDGAEPFAGLIIDAAGNLYGTTREGGTYGDLGTVFELTPQAGGGWTEQVLQSFNDVNGAEPFAGLTFDAVGNLYGTTYEGGVHGAGTVFELTPTGGEGWTEQVLYSFCSQTNCTDGTQPWAGLIFDAAGNLYGETLVGGVGGSTYGGEYTGGTVFELTPTGGGNWTETLLHSFGSGTDGANPSGGLIFDAAGNVYGTTEGGGTYGTGTAFELTPTAGGGWTEQVLHSFNNNGTDGAYAEGGLIFDAAGNLYGTTEGGGAYDICSGGCGTVFELTPVYRCSECSHCADRELNVLPAERRDMLKQSGTERP